MSSKKLKNTLLKKKKSQQKINDNWLLCGEIALKKDEYLMLFICKLCQRQIPTFGQFLQHSLQHYVLPEYDKLNEIFVELTGNILQQALQEKREQQDNQIEKARMLERNESRESLEKMTNENFTDAQMQVDVSNDNNETTTQNSEPTVIGEKQLRLNKHLLKQKPHCVRCTNELLNGRTPEKNCKICSLELFAMGVKNEKKFECNICGKKFTEKSNLNRHLKLHSGIVRCLCPNCGKTYTTRGELRRHIKVTHNNEKPYVCTECSKAFPSNYKLKYHMLRHLNERPFKCEFCDKQFFDNKALQRHLSTHKDERNFACNFCILKCKSKNGLRQHLKTHSNVKSYVCSLCDEAFKQSAGLAGHQHRRHPELYENKN